MKDDPPCGPGKRRHVRKMVAAQVRSAPSHSGHRSPGAYRSRRPQARSSCQCAAQSLAQALKDGTQQYWICAALYADRRSTWKLDVNRTSRSLLLMLGKLPRLSLARSSHCDRKQSCARGGGIQQLATLERTPPLEHLVRVQSMSTCYQRHARARFQREIYNLPLLGSGPKSTDPTCRPFCLNHEHIVRPRPVNEPEGKTERLRLIRPTAWPRPGKRVCTGIGIGAKTGRQLRGRDAVRQSARDTDHLLLRRERSRSGRSILPQQVRQVATCTVCALKWLRHKIHHT